MSTEARALIEQRRALRAWWDDGRELLAFARAVYGADLAHDVESARDLFRRPWQADRLYLAWVQAGRPPTIGLLDEGSS